MTLRSPLAVAPCLLALGALLAGCPENDTSENNGSSGGASGGASSSGGGAGSTSSGGGAGSTSSGGGASSASASGGASSAAGSSGAASASGASSSGGAASASSSSSSSGTAPAYIWAHTNRDLYRVDANTLAVSHLGAFSFEDENGNAITGATMTDLAVASNGAMWGCGLSALYVIDPFTLTATRVAMLGESYTGLTFVPVGVLDPSNEVLVGATQSDGSIYRIDTQTGATTLIGSYGNNWQTSGDIVAVQGDGMYATVKRTGETTDFLARIEPTTGVATIIGTQGIGDLRFYGLGYWNGVLYGFNTDGEMWSINRETGVGTLVDTQSNSWWGAGVTTLAKIPGG